MLVKELQSLGLNIRTLDKDGNDVQISSITNDEDTFTYSNKAAAMLAEDEMDEDEDEIAQSFLIKDVDDPDFGEELGYGDDYDNYDNN